MSSSQCPFTNDGWGRSQPITGTLTHIVFSYCLRTWAAIDRKGGRSKQTLPSKRLTEYKQATLLSYVYWSVLLYTATDACPRHPHTNDSIAPHHSTLSITVHSSGLSQCKILHQNASKTQIPWKSVHLLHSLGFLGTCFKVAQITDMLVSCSQQHVKMIRSPASDDCDFTEFEPDIDIGGAQYIVMIPWDTGHRCWFIQRNSHYNINYHSRIPLLGCIVHLILPFIEICGWYVEVL